MAEVEVYNSEFTAEDFEKAIRAVPNIGENGNWFIGDEDTGIFAAGVKVTGATEGQLVQISSVNSIGVPMAWTPIDPPTGEDVWEPIADVTIEEDTQIFKQTWVGTPMRKVMINVASLAASANTNYMPVQFFTTDGADAYFNLARFYPEALPRTGNLFRTYIGEVFKIGEEPVLRLTEYRNGVRPTEGSFAYLDPVTSATTHGNGGYADAIYDQITGVQFMTYATFVAGTRFTVWGVVK